MSGSRVNKEASALLLTPGAGSDRDHHTLLAIEAALAPMVVERLDFPYRREGRKAPDRAPKLVGSVVHAAHELASTSHIGAERIVLGGRSMGGRMCSIAVAEGLPARALLLISYPLHPPGKPERLRVDHFPNLHVPCLFISGTRDPFGTPDELASATQAIPAPVTVHLIEGGRHDLAGADAEITRTVNDWMASID